MAQVSIKKHLKYGDVMLMVGDCHATAWSVLDGIEMIWNEGDIWTGYIDCCIPMNYKYCIVNQGTRQIVEWEEGNNRSITHTGNIQDIWGIRRVHLRLRNSIDCELHLNIIGTKFSKIRMKKNMVNKDTNSVYHEVTIDVPNNMESNIYYKYSTAVRWERSEARCINKDFTNCRTINNEYFKEDSSLDFSIDYDQITPTLWVGTYLYEEDIQMLKNQGIDAILNLQNDDDIVRRDLPATIFQSIEQVAKSNDILYVRYGIQDSNESDFLRKGLNAAKLLANLQMKGRRVYVHCTSGIQRSVQTIILYLTLYVGLELEVATNLLISKRKRSKICRGVLKQLVNNK